MQAAQETAPPALTNTTGVASSATDIDQIRAKLVAFSNQFANGLPSVGVLRPYLSADFLDRDSSAEDTLADFTSFAPLSKASFTDVTIRSIDYSNPQRPVAHVSFLMKGETGTLISFAKHWQMVKDNGQWLLHGDQRALDIELVAMMNEGHNLNKSQGQTTPSVCRESGFSLIVEDYDDDNSASVAYVVVRGPGLPSDGVRLDKPELGALFTQPARPNNGNFYALTSSCNTNIRVAEDAISAIPANAEYTVTAYDENNAPVGTPYTDIIPARPLTLTELNAATFPAPTNFTLANWASFQGGALNLQIGNLNPTGLGLVEGFVGYSNNDSAEAEDEKEATAQGTMSAALTLPAAPNGAFIWHRRIEFVKWNNDWREYISFWNVSGQ